MIQFIDVTKYYVYKLKYYYFFFQIRNNDIPERMQLREIPVTPVPEGSDELDDEAEWIYKQAFCKPTITTQVKYILFYKYKN